MDLLTENLQVWFGVGAALGAAVGVLVYRKISKSPTPGYCIVQIDITSPEDFGEYKKKVQHSAINPLPLYSPAHPLPTLSGEAVL